MNTLAEPLVFSIPAEAANVYSPAGSSPDLKSAASSDPFSTFPVVTAFLPMSAP